MQKHKHNESSNDNNQLLIGLGILFVLAATGVLGGLIELVFGIIGAVIGIVVGVIGAVIGIVFGVLGAVLGIGGAVIGIVAGTAILWVPLLIWSLDSKRTKTGGKVLPIMNLL
jgi:hypothetical protein